MPCGRTIPLLAMINMILGFPFGNYINVLSMGDEEKEPFNKVCHLWFIRALPKPSFFSSAELPTSPYAEGNNGNATIMLPNEQAYHCYFED